MSNFKRSFAAFIIFVYAVIFSSVSITAAAGEFRSELTSVNGKPYTYTRWKKAAYTPISGYATLGTSLNDAEDFSFM